MRARTWPGAETSVARASMAVSTCPLMAAAATLTVVQARSVVEPGEIDPEQVITPGLFVDRIVEVSDARQEEALMREGVAYA